MGKKQGYGIGPIAFFWKLVVFICLPLMAQAYQKAKPTVDIRLQPASAKSKFGGKKAVVYKISLANYLKTDQEGTLDYTVTNAEGDEVLSGSLELRVNARKKLNSAFEIPMDDAGSYGLKVQVNLTDYQQSFSDKFSYSGTPAKGRKPSGAVLGTPMVMAAENNSSENAAAGEAAAEEAPAAEEEEEYEGEIIPVFKPAKEDAIFYGKEPIKYAVTLSNKYKIKQEGSFTMIVETERGVKVSETKINLKIPRKGMKKFYMTLPTPPEPGIYMLRAATNTTTYDDTAALAFGYDINKIKTPYFLPPDFDDFWRDALAELATVDPQYKITPDPGRSTKYHDVYRIDMMGLGNVPFYAYLTVPKLKGKYPVVVGYGGYEKFVQPLLFGDFVTLAVNVRNLEPASKELINPEDIEQLLLNIENKDEYIYRGIYMDCVRAVDFIFSHAHMGMDLNRVIAFGGSQGASLGIITAALLPNKINAVVASNPVFADWKNSIEIGLSKRKLSFPADEIKKYLDKNPGTTPDTFFPTLHYYDLQNFMPKVTCPLLYAVGLLDEFIPPGSALAAYNKLSPMAMRKSELFIFPKLGHEIPSYHNSFIGNWFSEQTVGKGKK